MIGEQKFAYGWIYAIKNFVRFDMDMRLSAYYVIADYHSLVSAIFWYYSRTLSSLYLVVLVPWMK